MKYFALLLFTILTPIAANSQGAWQWAKEGGSTNSISRGEHNQIIDIKSDSKGNIYLLGRIGGIGIKVNGQADTGYSTGINGTLDILLCSFTPQGQLRWKKIIGGDSGDYGHSLELDSKGHIYLCGRVSQVFPGTWAVPIHFDSDTTLPWSSQWNQHKKLMFLAQYDTAGNFNWLRMPEPDTVSYATQTKNNSFSYRLKVDDNDVVHWFCHLRKGAFNWNGNNVITTEGDYILKYTAAGQVAGRTKLDMESDPLFFSQFDSKEVLAMDNITGNYYVGGVNENLRPLLMGGDTVRERFYIGAFDATGNHLWTREGTAPRSPTNNGIYDIKLDDNGDIFIAGEMEPNSNFLGFTFSENRGTSLPCLFKLDNNGNLIWGKRGKVSARSRATALAVSDSEVAITGYAASLRWPGELDTLTTAPNQGYDAFLARFDKGNGDLLVMDRTTTNFGGQAFGYALHRDYSGAYYMGGNFDQFLYLAGDTLSKVGSQRGFFVTKYQCELPEVDYTFKADSSGYRFYYTGTAKDSIFWWFGDGSPAAHGDTVWHAYDSIQDYRVCIKVFNDCSDIVHCDTVKAGTVGLVDDPVEERISFYPNPVKDRLNFHFGRKEHKELEISFSNLQGQIVKRAKIKEGALSAEVATGDMPEGIYLLRLYEGRALIFKNKVLVNR